MKELKGKLLSVKNGSVRSCGGNQQWAESRQMRQCGCGVVSSTDTLLYLGNAGTRGGFVRADGGEVELGEYNALLTRMRRRFLPLIPHFGINGFGLSLGMNRYFHRFGIPLRAHWRVSPRRIWDRIGHMLDRDMPVVLSAGPNFPFFWRKRGVPLYTRQADGTYRKASSAVAHYVTVTGMDEQWLRVSSWGREYYISRDEYDAYMRHTSCPLFSNILELCPRKNGRQAASKSSLLT